MAHATIYFATKAAEFEVELGIDGNVTFGGSNSYGSDEPAWAEVSNVVLTLPNGKPLPRRMEAALTRADWEAIEEALIEAEGW